MITKIKRFLKKAINYIHVFVFKLTKKSIYYLFEEEIVKTISKKINVVSPIETLDQIENSILNNKRGAYLRFGDGDVFLLKGKKDAYQTNSDLLSDEMKEAFLIQGNHIYKCLAIHSDFFGYEEGMVLGNHKNTDKLALKLFTDSFLFFVGSKIYSPVALHFISTIDPLRANSFLKTLKIHTRIFVGNESIEPDYIKLLFGKDTTHIKTPSRNAYNDIERIEKQTIDVINKSNKDFFVICVAMGCSGRPFMKRIWTRGANVFLFDFGSLLDGIVGNKSRQWLKLNEIDYGLLLKELDDTE
jgi:hypothetical protein